MFYSVQQGSRYILSLTNQRYWFEVRRLHNYQQIKAHGYTVKQVSRYLHHATFCIMILVSLHTKSSSMFHAEFVYKLLPPKWRILTVKTLSCKLTILALPCNKAFTSQKYFPTKIFPYIFHIKPFIFKPFSWSHSLSDFHEIFSIKHAEFVYKLLPPKWRILTVKTLSCKLRRLSICSFDQITSLLFFPM
jgi:hypothetical protein